MNYFTVERNETGEHLFILKNMDNLRCGDVFARKNLDGTIETLGDIFPNLTKEFVNETIDDIDEMKQYEFETFLDGELKEYVV
jgi:hypothetical protein